MIISFSRTHALQQTFTKMQLFTHCVSSAPRTMSGSGACISICHARERPRAFSLLPCAWRHGVVSQDGSAGCQIRDCSLSAVPALQHEQCASGLASYMPLPLKPPLVPSPAFSNTLRMHSPACETTSLLCTRRTRVGTIRASVLSCQLRSCPRMVHSLPLHSEAYVAILHRHCSRQVVAAPMLSQTHAAKCAIEAAAS